jgi:hypothetical protein
MLWKAIMNKKQAYAVERWVMAQTLGSKTSGHKLVLLTLAIYANRDGHCWPKQKTLAENCDLTRQTVNGHLHWLQQRGYIDARPRFDAGGQTSNEYLILFREALCWPDGTPATYRSAEEVLLAGQGESGGPDNPCLDVPTPGVVGPGHLEEKDEDPEQEPVEERRGEQPENSDGDELFGLSRYIEGLGQRGVLKPEWATADYAKPEWQSAWMAYVRDNGEVQVTQDLDRLFDLIDDSRKPGITKKYEADQTDWSKVLSGLKSVQTFVSRIDAIRSARARFAEAALMKVAA